MDAEARIALLGKPALFVEGRLQPFSGPRKVVSLIAYVLLHRDRVLSRAAVAERFWPDDEDEDARAALRRHLHRALATLPPAPPDRPWIIADKQTLRWNADAPIVADTVEYDRLTGLGRREAAIELYRGEYLEDHYDEWILPERERFRELQSSNLVALIEERRRARDFPAAIAYAQRLRRLDPLREDAIRRLMSLHFAAGDRSSALAEFDAFARRLHEELAARPMPETIALQRAIQNDDVAALPGTPLSEKGSTRNEPSARHGTPFVGRSAALATLGTAWESAARGGGRVAIVSGEAGAGKTRLIGELRAIAEAQGGRVVSGSTSPIESEPYQAFAEALRAALPLLRFERLDAVKMATLAAFVPDVRDYVKNLPDVPLLEPERDRRRLFDAVESALYQLAEKRPLVIVLEDLHWAGAATIDLLDFVTRRVADRSTLIVVSFREELMGGSHALRAFVRRVGPQRSSHVALGPLAPEDVAALVAAMIPQANPETARELFEASEGNALFATELLRGRIAGTGENVSDGIAGTVAARVRQLTPAARSLLETAAVLGTGFDAEIVREVAGWSFAEAFDALGELLDRAIVRESVERRGDFAFSHQLVHAAVYGMLDQTTRRRLHRRVATTLERLFPERPSLLAMIARHYDVAGFPKEAAAAYVGAARHAAGVFAYDESMSLATSALALAPEARERFEAHLVREEAAARAGDVAARRSDCEALAILARELGDELATGTALCRRVGFERDIGARAAERALVRELGTFGERAASPRWRLEATIARARMAINEADLPKSDAILAAAIPDELSTGDDDGSLRFEYWFLRAFAMVKDDRDRARGYLAEARGFAAGVSLREVRAERIAAMIADEDGDFRELEAVATRLLERYVEIGDIEGQALAHQNLAISAWYRFDIESDRAHLREAIDLFGRVQKPGSLASVLINRGALAQHLGAFDRAGADYEEALALGRGVENRETVLLAMANLCSLAVFRGDPVRGRALGLEAVAFAREHALEAGTFVALEYLAAAERDLGLVDDAIPRFEAVLAFRRDRDPRAALETLIEIIPAYLAAGRVAAAVAAADDLHTAVANDLDRVTFPALALAAAASAFAAAGRDAQARSLRAEAVAVLHDRLRRLPDEVSREGYGSLSFHRAIARGESAERATSA